MKIREVVALQLGPQAVKTAPPVFCRHSLVVKHCLGKTETVSPILTGGSFFDPRPTE